MILGTAVGVLLSPFPSAEGGYVGASAAGGTHGTVGMIHGMAAVGMIRGTDGMTLGMVTDMAGAIHGTVGMTLGMDAAGMIHGTDLTTTTVGITVTIMDGTQVIMTDGTAIMASRVPVRTWVAAEPGVLEWARPIQLSVTASVQLLPTSGESVPLLPSAGRAATAL